MLNNKTDVIYSSQKVSGRRRILATQNGDTRTVVTLDDKTATQVTAHLNTLASERRVALYLFGTNNTGQVCTLRRTLIGSVLDGPRPNGPALIDDLATAVATVSAAEKRAVADEVGRIYDGTDDVIVPVALLGEFNEAQFYCVANDWLTDAVDAATDQDVLDIIDPNDTESYALYEGLLAQLRSRDEDIEDACSSEWIDVNIDVAALTAWARRNRPHLSEQIDELLEDA